MSAAKGGWDRLAVTYRWQEPLEAAGWQVALAHARVRPDDRVADLGCGTGLLARRLARRDEVPRQLVGIDTSPRMLRRAARVGERAVIADLAALPLADGSVDVAVLGWSLHVVDAESRRRSMVEVARVLAEGGRAVVLVPGQPRTAPGRVVRAVALRVLGSLTPPRDLDDVVAAAGLRVDVDVRVGGGLGYATRVLLLRRAPAT